jgi:hypothetical protein
VKKTGAKTMRFQRGNNMAQFFKPDSKNGRTIADFPSAQTFSVVLPDCHWFVTWDA